MIPRRLFWILDFAMVAIAFGIAYAAWPVMHDAVAHVDISRLPAVLQPQPVTTALPEFRSIVWILLVAGCAAILIMEAGEGYRPLLQQSRARLFLT